MRRNKRGPAGFFVAALACAGAVWGLSGPAAGGAAESGTAVRKLVEAQQAIGDLQADFSLTIAGAAAGHQDLQAGGKLWLAPGRRYRVEYTRPETQLLVSNGSQRWLYLKKINQVQKQALPPEGSPSEFFLELGGGLATWLDRCQVSAIRVPGQSQDEHVFELVPRPGQDLSFTRARLWLSGKQLLPRRVVVEAARRVTAEFSRVRVHTRRQLKRDPAAGLPASLFAFTPPPDAEVIEPLWPVR